MAKKKNVAAEKAPKVHSDLSGFEMKIDSFGQIISSLDRDKINAFLDKEMPGDKKLNLNADEGQ